MARRSRHPSSGDASRPVGRGVSIASRLAATMLGVGFVSLVAATLVGVQAGQALGESIVDDSLVSLRGAGNLDVAAQLRHYQRIAGQLAGTEDAAATIQDFAAGVAELESTPATEVRADRDLLVEAYQERFLAPLQQIDADTAMSDILATDPAAIVLQARYSLPEGSGSDPISVTDAGDGSAWSAVHAEVHPAYRDTVRQADLLDVYLVDAASERIVYSAAKGPDLGTSLAVGPFSGSVVARAADAALSADGGVVVDMSFYDAVPGVAVAAAAAPVRDGDRLVGVVVVTYDGSVYGDRLVSLAASAAGADPSDASGDLYLVGADGRLRSEPRSLRADRSAFLDAAAAAGTITAADRTEIEATGTAALTQPAADGTVNAAFDGETGVVTSTSMTGAGSLDAVAAVPVDGVTWYVVAEVDAEAARSTIASFRQILLVGAAVFVVALAFTAVTWATRFMAPVRMIAGWLGRSVRAGAGVGDPGPVTIPDSSPVELHRLAGSLRAMGDSLRRQERDLRDARAERLAVLQRMLPPAAAQRIARGDVDSLDEVPSATVAVVVVLGLGGAVGREGGVDRRLFDELHAELDGIAAVHGLDRIKVVGDSYFAVCGHDRPYIDHAPRALAFAEQVADRVRGLAATAGVPLDTAIGISTGTVTVGLSGGSAVVYDVWGPAVTTAHTLARSAPSGQIVVTDVTRGRLPDEIGLVAWHRAGEEPGDERLWRVAEPAEQAGTEAGR
ncbi:adenylate/guanylate cyclase domain-containing protein [Actinotalea sp. M2MS4P-6]|uniref:adenylate/guanylate cyclase domain-containing protein n=1 Tax=Actinotalea sp. M2MS4P-6 TaxID=2983762 RepID=UPI0021E46E80|nr:adenylate/guanylate cyclase domain-containing protein [Actinotalea sp. M2MS4P-6]MCV2396335.1 adenylate/guanylate cyclase domain-containing protein [Actinotalea sp. M2MS4P-6]